MYIQYKQLWLCNENHAFTCMIYVYTLMAVLGWGKTFNSNFRKLYFFTKYIFKSRISSERHPQQKFFTQSFRVFLHLRNKILMLDVWTSNYAMFTWPRLFISTRRFFLLTIDSQYTVVL